MGARVGSSCRTVTPLLVALSLMFICARLSSAETLSYSTSLSRDRVVVDKVGESARVVVNGEGYHRTSDEGLPVLPYRLINILLPRGQQVESVSFAASEALLIGEGLHIETAPATAAEDGTIGRGAALAPSVSSSAALGRYLGTGYLHGHTIASFAIFPIHLNDGDLELTETVTINVATVAAVDAGVVVPERYRSGHDEKLASLLRRLVVNPEVAASYRGNETRVEKPKGGFQPTAYPSLEGSPVDYVIITTDALAGEYQRLADWKTAKGVATVVRTVEWIVANTRNGVDLQETIRFFVRDAYVKWGITYLLLGGDTDILPPRYAISRFYLSGQELPVDMYFACLDGSWNDNHNALWGEVPDDNPDLYAEVFSGRMPVSDLGDVVSAIDKIIGYETPADLDYTDRVLLLAEVLFPIDWQPGDPISLNGADIAEAIYQAYLLGLPLDVVRMYQTENLFPGSVHLSRDAAIDSLNSGFNHVLIPNRGAETVVSMGDGLFLNEDADALTNTDRWTNFYIPWCSCAAFDQDCLAEHLLANPGGGAVSVVGSNDVTFVSIASAYMHEHFDLLFQQDVVHTGELFAASRLPRTPLAEAMDSGDLWQHYVMTLLADPEMPLYTGAAATPVVTHVSDVPLGESSIQVTVTAGGQPVEAARVCLSKEGDDYETGLTDASGVVTLDFAPTSQGTIIVVATGLNLARYQGYINANAPASAFVRFSGLSVDDDADWGSFGNGDGVIDAGETIDFTLDVENTGGMTSDSVWVVLRSTDPSVTIQDSIAAVGVVGAAATATALDPVRVMFDVGIADEAAIEFLLEIHDASPAMWHDAFKKVVHSPVLRRITLRIDDDPPLGNGNGIVESMEEFGLFYEVKNYGTGSANALAAELEDVSGGFTFFDSTDSYPDLGSFQSGENVAGFRLIETDAMTESILRVAITDLFGRVHEDSIELRPPLPPGTPVIEPRVQSDRMRVSWPQSPSNDVLHYQLHRSLTSSGPYTLANVDPLDHAVYLDTGLLSLTRYYYVVVAVDASGNQSVASAEASASTVPAQMSGFPNGVKTKTTSSPAVGDIDGDGDQEIVVGSDKVYAWHHDGAEVVDGDGDPLTDGVLSPLGSDFFAAIALASLDNRPGLDIIAADFGTASVHCFDFNGAPLPGWPKVAENGFRAAPVAGDLDGDGFLEVIAIDDRGVIYVWRRDGTEFRDGDNDPMTDGVFYRTPETVFHYQTPTVCDLNGDNKDEVIVGTRADTVYVLNGEGVHVPGWPFALPDEAAGSIAVGDIDDDGLPELVVRAKSSEVYLLNHDGTISAGWPRFIPGATAFFAPSPALADFDGDGTLEIVIVKDDPVDASVFVVTHAGADYPGWPVVFSTDDYTESSPTVADISGDHSLDIVLGDESGRLFAWDINGNIIGGFPILASDAFRATPYLADVDLDGDVDLLAHNWDQNIYLYDLAGAYSDAQSPWPTLQANNHRNGKFGFVAPTGIDDTDVPVAQAQLLQNHPNPFNPTTQITYLVPSGAPQPVQLVVYDVTGARVRTLTNAVKPAGRHVVVWDGRDAAGSQVGSGVYFYRLQLKGFAATKKMVLLK